VAVAEERVMSGEDREPSRPTLFLSFILFSFSLSFFLFILLFEMREAVKYG